VNPQYPEERAEEVDLETEVRDLAALNEIIRKPLRPERLEEFARVSRGRSELVEKAVWGQIRWKKGIGRPSSPRLADGFVIEHRFYDGDEQFTEAGIERMYGWIGPLESLVKWDMEDDENFYVAFRSLVREFRPNGIAVRFADGVLWRRVEGSSGRGIRFIEPPVRHFNLDDAPPKVNVLEDFEVTFIHTKFLP
jgi:hypothetical protein